MRKRAGVICVFVVAACGGGSSSDTDAGPPVISPQPGGELWIHEPITIAYGAPAEPVVTVEAGDGTSIDAAVTASADQMTWTVRVPASERLLGELHVTVDGEELTWTVPAWERPASAPDGAARVAATDDGRVFAVWEGPQGAVVAEAIAGEWVPLGDALPDGHDATLAIDGDGALVAAWGASADPNATLSAARWDGEAWVDLPSPGVGALARLAGRGDGDPVIAFVAADGGIEVRRLSGDSWSTVGTIATSASFGLPTAPAVAVSGTSVAVATHDASTAQLRVFVSADTGFTEAPPIAVAGSQTQSIAIAPDGVVLAWDQDSGHSWSVHVARIDGQAGWQPLGSELDVDPPADAQGVALAVDDAGAPVVAWTERIEGNQRGLAARWNGAAWVTVGGDVWNDDPATEPAAPTLALARGSVPVIGSSSVARFNGPGTPRFGLETRAPIGPCHLDAPGAGTPPTLTSTGCFTIAGGRATAAPGLIPFDINDELWSDGAVKRRWIALPDGQQLTPRDGLGWDVPVGTMLIKEFAVPDNSAVMETRFLIRRTDATWEGYSFEWRADGSDADLAPDTQYTRDWPMGATTHTHVYPSRSDCLTCHDDGVGFVLGLRTGQLARRFDYDGIVSDQIATLEHIGAVSAASGNTVSPFAAAHDPQESLYRRLRGYLAANCSHCHNPGGVRPTRDFRWETALESTNLCAVVTPGDPAGSLIYQRVSSRPGMPPLATLQTDPLVLDVLSAWITSITTCP